MVVIFHPTRPKIHSVMNPRAQQVWDRFISSSVMQDAPVSPVPEEETKPCSSSFLVFGDLHRSYCDSCFLS